jgi:hypothetical protein
MYLGVNKELLSYEHKQPAKLDAGNVIAMLTSPFQFASMQVEMRMAQSVG